MAQVYKKSVFVRNQDWGLGTPSFRSRTTKVSCLGYTQNTIYFAFFYEQYLILFTMVPRNKGFDSKKFQYRS